MCLFDRNTDRRGRSAVPRTFLRTRKWRRLRASTLWSVISFYLWVSTARVLLSLRRLAGLAEDALVGVADALALVGLGLADLADVGRHLAHELLVEPLDRDAGGRGNLERDALGRVDRDWVREAELQLELRRALGDGAVADADDLELPGEAGRHAGDHVRDERASEAVEGAVLALVV